MSKELRHALFEHDGRLNYSRSPLAEGGAYAARALSAVHRFFLSNVRPNVPLECFQDSNSFRADFCYTEDVDMALREHETSLRGLYHAIAHGSGAIGNALSSTKLMDLEEYMDFCHRIRIVIEPRGDHLLSQRWEGITEPPDGA